MRYRCILELTPTIRSSAMRITYEEPGDGGILIDLPGKDAEATCSASDGIITALTHKNSGGVQSDFATYFYIRCDRPIASFAVKETGDRQVAEVRFATKPSKPVVVRVGTSFISYDQARLNLKQEIGEKSFQALLQDAEDKWESELGRVRIQGRTEVERRTFYSCLYRTLLFPRVWHEVDSAGQTVHRSPYTGRVEPGVLYADHGLWDDYHAWYPMMALLYPERLSEILQGWVNAYQEGGWIPQFPCPGYRGAMTGSPSDMVFGDAVAKGIKGFDLATAFDGLKKGATVPVRGFGFGRTQLKPYLELGFVPSGNGSAGVAQTLDYAYGDFCVSQVARALGRSQDAAFFFKRSSRWKNVFDTKIKFFRGRSADGSWIEPFNAFAWGGAYVEGGPWQYRFNVPHDPHGLFEAFGGEAKCVEELEKMFVQPPRFDVGTYGGEIHEMAEMAAVKFGQYAQCNQPVHNVLYLFTIAGRRDRTQYYAHRVLSELYSPDDFPGDEDTGSMSAWYVLSALGLFSACPGSSRWTLGAPYFDAATVKFPSGESLEIIARNRRGDKFLNKVNLNGQLIDGIFVEHAELRNAQIVFEAT
jgi:predicted alpha-1,2-mannosidase